jgi:hypothetical protein
MQHLFWQRHDLFMQDGSSKLQGHVQLFWCHWPDKCVNPSNRKFRVTRILKKWVATLKEHTVFITNTCCLGEYVIAVYTENYIKPINASRGQNDAFSYVEAGCMYSYCTVVCTVIVHLYVQLLRCFKGLKNFFIRDFTINSLCKIACILQKLGSLDSSVSIVTKLQENMIRFRAGVINVFPSKVPRLALGLNQPRIQWVQGLKRSGCEADHSLRPKLRILGAIPPLPHMTSTRGRRQDESWRLRT